MRNQPVNGTAARRAHCGGARRHEARQGVNAEPREAPQRWPGRGAGLHDGPTGWPPVVLGQGAYRRAWPPNQLGISDREPDEEAPSAAAAVWTMAAILLAAIGAAIWLAVKVL